MTSIGDYTFYGCSSLTNIDIPNSVTSIGNSAFNGCSGLTSVTIPNSVTRIGIAAFQNCSSLQSVYSEIESPFTISDNAFDYSYATVLYVPNGTVDTYKSTSGWKKFSKILDVDGDTDVSQIANTIYIESMEGICGGQLTISVKMKNKVTAQGFGFDLYLPEGVTVAKDANGLLDVSLSTARTTTGNTNTFNSVIQADGSLRVSATLTGGSPFSGNDGEVAVVKVSIANDMAEGDWPIILKQVTVTDENTDVYNTDYLKSTLTIVPCKLGDVNGDKKVNVTDFTGIANHMLNRTPANFNSKAADVNKDNNIDATDLTAVANIILYGLPYRPTVIISNGGKEKKVNDATLSSYNVYVNYNDVLSFKDREGKVPGSDFKNFIDHYGIEVGINEAANTNLLKMCRTDVAFTNPNRQKLTDSDDIEKLPSVYDVIPEIHLDVDFSNSNIGQDINGNVTGGFRFIWRLNFNTNSPFHIYLPLEVKYSYANEEPDTPITVWAIITFNLTQGNTTN